MIIGASLFFQSEDSLNRLLYFKGLQIQLGFFKTKYLNLFLDKNYIEKFYDANIKITSIHAPNIKIHSGTKHTCNILEKCLTLLSNKVSTPPNITLHPQRAYTK